MSIYANLSTSRDLAVIKRMSMSVVLVLQNGPIRSQYIKYSVMIGCSSRMNTKMAFKSLCPDLHLDM
jgi:hypothetical protein